MRRSLIIADARVALRHIPSCSVDMICTDPPYTTISGGNGSKAPGGRGTGPTGMLSENNGKGGLTHNSIKFSEYLHDLYRVLRDPGHVYLMVNMLNLEAAMLECRRAGFDIHAVLVARRNNVTPSRWYMKNADYVIFARKGAAVPINNPSSKVVHDWVNPVGKKVHPNEKSVDLMRLYIENSSQPGDVVLDPFAGSGSTGVACMETGRNFLGIELDPVHAATACRRLGVMPS